MPLGEDLYDTAPSPTKTEQPQVAPVVQPKSGPAPSSTAPGNVGGTPGEDSQPEPAPEPPLPAFDPRWREPFNGLMFIGALTDTFEWLGHQFRIRTLTTEELLEVGLLAKPYQGTEGDSKAYQAAVVAGCVTHVDGKPMPDPLTSEITDTGLSNRFRYVMEKWYSPTLDVVYDRYFQLELKVRQVVEAMGNLPG